MRRRWCGRLDFQFDSTIDGKAIKIASMLDEHTRESLLNIVERSITADRLIDELEKCFAAAGGPPMVLRMDNGPELISQALQSFCAGKVGLSYIPPGRRGRTATSNRSTTAYEGSASTATTGPTCSRPAWSIGDFKHEHNHRHRHSALGYLTPAEYAARCSHTHHPVACEIN